MTELDKLMGQFETVRKTITEIDNGAAYVAIVTPHTIVNTEDIFDSPRYLNEIRGDLLYYRQDLRKQIMEALQEDEAKELGYETKGVEPFPVGTPKNDYRRHDTDDGK
ncbi:MAG: hypothetical protein IIZ78_11565 [Clostridiales bacterium]|nr:hypothetical protein [Clostridiales bacterium]